MDLRQWSGWCAEERLKLFGVSRAYIELYARWLEETGKARAPISRRLSTIVGLYRNAGEERLIDVSPAVHARRPGHRLGRRGTPRGAAVPGRDGPPPGSTRRSANRAPAGPASRDHHTNRPPLAASRLYHRPPWTLIPFSDLDAISEEVWDRVMAVNATGPFLCSRSAAPSLRRAGGAIVNVSSVAGIFVTRSSLPYGVSKAALTTLTRMLALALASAARAPTPWLPAS